MSDRTMTSAKEPNVEAAVCGSFREPIMFWLWRNMAGSPNPGHVANIKGVRRIQFETHDGIELRGYKRAAENPRAYLLVAQGNAMLADHLVSDLQPFRDRGWDIYIYDYRG